MIRALSACNSSSLTLYLYSKRRQNHFSMVLVVKHNSYKIDSNLGLLAKQRWQIDAIGVLKSVIGDIMKLPAGCYISSAQGALCEPNEAAPSNHQEKRSLFSPGSSPQLEKPEQNPPFSLYSTSGSVLGSSCTKQVFLMSELQSFCGSDP